MSDEPTTAAQIAPDPTTDDYERAVTARWDPRNSTIRSFWQSPVVAAEINRRVTGDPQLSPPEYFARVYCATPRKRALSLGCGDGGIELGMLRLGVCEQLVAVDLAQARLDRFAAATPPELAGRVQTVCANLESWRPEGRFDLVIANGVVHHLQRLEGFFDLVDDVLADDGLIYLDEFVGPSRFQWTDKQLSIINRLLDCMSPELREDLVLPELGTRPPVTRPSPDALIAADPSEAARSAEIPDLLHRRLRVIEERPWGGAIFHQLFNRIMGNFAEQGDLVRVLMEVDAILTEEGVIGNDYLWGVYAPRSSDAGGLTSRQTDGRVEAVEGDAVVGWAADPGAPARRLSLDLHVDHRLVAKGVADLPRADLASAGIGDGAHAFAVALPAAARDGTHHALSVVVGATGETIPTAHGWSERNRAMPECTVFSVAEHATGRALRSARVLGSPDGWAFACDDEFGSLQQMLGTLALTEPDLAHYRGLLTDRAAWLNQLGIDYLVAVVPAKASVHPEHLPPSTPPLSPPLPGRQLLGALQPSPVRTVDLLAPLRAAALAGQQLYYKRGSSWNHRGALIGAQAVAEGLRGAGVAAGPVEADQSRWSPESYEGDLAGRPAVVIQAGRPIPTTPTGITEAGSAPGPDLLTTRHADVSAQLHARDPDTAVFENPTDSGLPRAAVIADPDRGRLAPLLSAAFSTSVWVSGWHQESALVKAARPDVVVQLLDETRLVRVPYGVAS